MIKICTQCGAVNDGHPERCYFCDARLAPAEEIPAPVQLAGPTEGNLAVEPQWRREVADRVQAYRARRGRKFPNSARSALAFREPQPAAVPPRAGTVERVEIEATPGRELAGALDLPLGVRAAHRAWRDGSILPVAALERRRRSGLLDAVFLLFAGGGFLALFRALGGHLSFGRFDALVYAAILALFYAHYFALFTLFAGATPGMLLARLRVVSFDGGAPTTRQLFWRSFGYLLSGGTLSLGFLWALWDDDQLTWQDRLSQTYLADAEVARKG